VIDLDAALARHGEPWTRRAVVRGAIASGALDEPRWHDRLAAAVDDPYLAEPVVFELVPRIGAPLAARLRAALDLEGDLADLLRLRGVLAIERAGATDLLQGALADGSPLVREGMLACVAAGLPGTEGLVAQCVAWLSPMTNMRVEDYMRGRLFSLRHGMRCDAAIRLLDRAPEASSPWARLADPRARHSAFDAPQVRKLAPAPAPTRRLPEPAQPDRAKTQAALGALGGARDHVELDRAVEALGRCGDDRALAALVRLLDGGGIDRHEPPTIRSHERVVDAILRIGGEAAIPRLVTSLTRARPDTYAFYAVIDALVAAGGPAAERGLAKVLAACGHLTGSPGPYLVAVLPAGVAPDALLAVVESRAASPDTRCSALARLATLADPRIVPALAALLGSRHAPGEVLAGAIAALAGQGDAHAVDPLLALLAQRPGRPVRLALIRALGILADRRALAPLLRERDDADRDPELGAAVAEALGGLRDPGGLAPLVDELGRASRFDHRLAVIEALGRLGPPAHAVLRRELADPLYDRVAPASVGALLRAALTRGLARN
jgi:HEAT repeat protein